MSKRYRVQAALALITCLPYAPAWAASVTDTPKTASGTASASAVMDFPASPSDAADALAHDRRPDMQMDWDLTQVGAAGRSVVLVAALPAATSFASPISLPDDHARYGPVTDTASDASPAIGAGAGPPIPHDRSGHVPREFAPHRGFFQQAGSSTTEVALLSGYVLAQGIPKLFKPTTGFHFKDEGWFGKDTQNVGMDKLTHAFNTYLIAEILHYRIHRNTGGSEGDALTAGILASGLMALNEISDAIEPDSGYSMQDIAMNVAGATFSVLRNTVPGLKEKLAFKIEIMPNHQIYSRTGKPHYEQQRFMFSLKGAGFETLEGGALKYLDLQVGYYASDFLNSDRDKGVTPKRHLFVGVGLNLGELLFGRSGSRIGRAAYSVLDYVQMPYTTLRYDTTGRFGS
jgi:hypothetical protein